MLLGFNFILKKKTNVETIDTVKDVLGKWGKKAAEASNKAQDLAGNMWQHCNSFFLKFLFLSICYYINIVSYHGI